MSIEQHTKNIIDSINAIEEISPVMGQVFHQSFAVGANTIEALYNAEQDIETIDIGKYIEMLNEIFGIKMDDLVQKMLEPYAAESQKEADQETLDFIMQDEDLDDYERFVKENQAKDNLDFLKNEI